MQSFVDRACADITRADQVAAQLGGQYVRKVDSIYLGGGTPSTLDPRQLEQIFSALRKKFEISRDCEITVECAPGTLSDEMLATFLRLGVNRVSLGVQSFIDQEAKAVARLHNRETTLRDISRLRDLGISNINVDLIAGLPHQTAASWAESVETAIATGVPHLSVYMLEVDEDSRLGRELIAGGQRYHAHHVPDQDATAEFYTFACEHLTAAGVEQYEISNFARAGMESKHNLKYWTRKPYLGFGLDAHSMLPTNVRGDNPKSARAVRFSTTDDLETFLAGDVASAETWVTAEQELEEEFFLGLRLNRGIRLGEIEDRIGRGLPAILHRILDDSIAEDLLQTEGDDRISLTHRGRLLSNEIFARFIDYQSFFRETSATR